VVVQNFSTTKSEIDVFLSTFTSSLFPPTVAQTDTATVNVVEKRNFGLVLAAMLVQY
jgi:hypothetical protein